LELILADELVIRRDRQIARRTKAASFRDQKSLQDFDWEFNTSIKRKQIFDLASGDFVRKHHDAIIVGPPGVGKSHIAQSIGHQLIRDGYTVYYRSIFDCVRDFLHDEAFEGHDRILNRYLLPDLLILDDMGMKQLPKRSGEFLFEIIMRRHELRSTMMTSNRPLEDWGKLIGDVPAATAILDRFLQDAELIEITGRSYRLRGNAAKSESTGNATPKSAKRAHRQEEAK
jgi:DNA replication protein DnaC